MPLLKTKHIPASEVPNCEGSGKLWTQLVPVFPQDFDLKKLHSQRVLFVAYKLRQIQGLRVLNVYDININCYSLGFRATFRVELSEPRLRQRCYLGVRFAPVRILLARFDSNQSRSKSVYEQPPAVSLDNAEAREVERNNSAASCAARPKLYR